MNVKDGMLWLKLKLKKHLNKKRLPTMYKNNSCLIAKNKVSKYKKGLCLTEKFAF